MNELKFDQMQACAGGEVSNFWQGFGCVSSVVAWAGSIAGLAVITGGTGAILAAAGAHILTDMATGISCAVWLS